MRKGRIVPASNSSMGLSIPRIAMLNRNARSFSTVHFPVFVREFVRPSKSASCRNAPFAKPPASLASPPPLPRAASFMPGSLCAKPASRKPGASAAPPDQKSFGARHTPETFLGSARRSSRRALWFYLPLLSGGRELLEHFLHSLVQILDVLVRVVGKGVARSASPQQLLRLRVEQIHHQRAYLVDF